MNFEIIQKMVEVSSAPQFDPGLGQLAWTAKGNGKHFGGFFWWFLFGVFIWVFHVMDILVGPFVLVMRLPVRVLDFGVLDTAGMSSRELFGSLDLYVQELSNDFYRPIYTP